jgi:UDP-glucose 4-epimerase
MDLDHIKTIERISQMQNTKVIVTGASGYIGGQICIQLKEKGYYVIGLDVREKSHLREFYDEFVKCDFDSHFSHKLIRDHKPEAIIHCAGTSLVGPSLKYPRAYFDNNVVKTLNYLNVLLNSSPKTKFIFSSSAAVYGEPDGIYNMDETHTTEPISPYGESKLMVEKMIKWFGYAHNLNYTIFRYFNACGADFSGRHGQDPGATHIFAKLFEACNNKMPFTLYGSNYNTKDGTCVRDYVHVIDIANFHIEAIEKNLRGIYNIGSGEGKTNLEIQTEVEKYTGEKLVTFVEPRRMGDPDYLVAEPHSLLRTPEYKLSDIIKSLDAWYASPIYNNLQRS